MHRAVAHTPFPCQAQRQARVVEALNRAQGLPRLSLEARALALDTVEADALEACSEQALVLRRGQRGLRQSYVEQQARPPPTHPTPHPPLLPHSSHARTHLDISLAI